MRIVTDYKHAQQIIIELDARIAELEAELEEWKDSCDPGVDKALTNSRVETDDGQ